MWFDIKRMLRQLTPGEVAARELVEAQLSHLEAQTAQEHAAALASFHAARGRRLAAFISALPKEPA